MTQDMSGLSPRVRGNPEYPVVGIVGDGSIPARAGEPGRTSHPLPPQPVYPRACGGTLDTRLHSHRQRGLSPRVRGNRGNQVCQDGIPGSIPARAGEPPCGPTVAGSCKVYPRACGGTQSALIHRGYELGLSPRVRGNRHSWSTTAMLNRSIPARAGEPPPTHSRAGSLRVYPRACGGTGMTTDHWGSQWGLSPRVRGNLVQSGVIVGINRSIPARAGEPAYRRSI